jgi:hypothetical protein
LKRAAWAEGAAVDDKVDALGEDVERGVGVIGPLSVASLFATRVLALRTCYYPS